MDHQAMMKEIERQEELLQFDHFNNEDALKLGLMLIEEARNRGYGLAVRITLGQSLLFYHRTTGTTNHNEDWTRRKGNTVHKLCHSSLWFHHQLKLNGWDVEKDRFLDPMEYACMGGGFPLTIKGCGVVGSICVSALPHEQDHKLIVDVLSSYLHVAL